MSRKFLLVFVQVFLGVAIGLITEVAATTINIDTRYVWGILIILLIFLVPTTWLQYVDQENPERSTLPRITIPEKINFSISVSKTKANLNHFVKLFLNAVILGAIIGYFGVVASGVKFIDFVFGKIADLVSSLVPGYVLVVEVIGACFIPLTSYFVMQRRNLLTGLIFSSISSISFSLVHLSLIPYQPHAITILGNLVSIVLITLLLKLVIPLVVKPLVEFWR